MAASTVAFIANRTGPQPWAWRNAASVLRPATANAAAAATTAAATPSPAIRSSRSGPAAVAVLRSTSRSTSGIDERNSVSRRPAKKPGPGHVSLAAAPEEATQPGRRSRDLAEHASCVHLDVARLVHVERQVIDRCDPAVVDVAFLRVVSSRVNRTASSGPTRMNWGGCGTVRALTEDLLAPGRPVSGPSATCRGRDRCRRLGAWAPRSAGSGHPARPRRVRDRVRHQALRPSHRPRSRRRASPRPCRRRSTVDRAGLRLSLPREGDERIGP